MSNINSLSWLRDDDRFLEVNYKLATGKALSEEESVFCLSVAILLIKEYERDRRRTSYLEFGYYLVLSYSLQSNNYEPLFDLSTNLGFYPISKFVLDNGMVPSGGINNYFVYSGLDKFKYQDITETLEQNKYRSQLVESQAVDSCYIAPTSFGKSSMMVELISNMKGSKVFVIVPTKSLLTQTYKLINSSFPDRKVIFHDEMYNGEEDFVAIFTQERALRLLKGFSGMKVDALLIDEAHNLFESSPRSILLSRLIRRVRKRKSDSRVFYFSPLINESDNLKFEEQQNIDTKRIQFNIKEADIAEYRLDGKVCKYNRFLNVFFDAEANIDMFDYLIQNKRSNNFVYLRSPRKVELFAGYLAERLPYLASEELERLSNTISVNVHEDFYCVDLIKKGVLYIHGKLPDLIKEYLEFNFRTAISLEFIVANSVILEGVNLPVDNLYILNTYNLGAKELTNLIGRVNRLNEVFGGDSPGLEKLKPSVHFVNSEEFNRARSNMASKIETLKSGGFKDVVKNPTLLSFDISKYDRIIENSGSKEAIEKASKERGNALSIMEREEFLTEVPVTDNDRMRLQFFETGLPSVYIDAESAFSCILSNIEKTLADTGFAGVDPIEKVYRVFILGLESNVGDASFARLGNLKARSYYRLFVRNIHSLTLKQNINFTVNYFYKNASETGNNIFYIGSSYGEVDRYGGYDGDRTYIDLSKQSHKKLVNLALVKLKMESDFLSYRLNEYVSLLLDYGVVSEEDYNVFIYGTSKKRNADLTKLGFSGAIIKKFDMDQQIENIYIDEFGHVSVNDEFKRYLERQDDLIQFEVKKYIAI